MYRARIIKYLHPSTYKYGFLREKWIGILVSNQPCRPSRISIAAVEPNASFPSKITNKNNFRF